MVEKNADRKISSPDKLAENRKQQRTKLKGNRGYYFFVINFL